MKNRKSLSILSIIMTVLIVYIIIENIKHNDPKAEIIERRSDVIENIEFLGSDESGSETLYFTLGEVIDSSNLFLTVDRVKKTWLGYRWTNGGGHMSIDIRNSQTMTLQYLGAFINMDEMIFGMISRDGIVKVSIQLNDKRLECLTYNSDKNDYLYYYVALEPDEMLQIDSIILIDNKGHESAYPFDTSGLVNQESDFKMITMNISDNQ